jgi:FAD/FMN-containing dehydrogenase
MVQRLGGRPHWGKMHTCSAAYLHSVYPQLERWLAVRAQLDPAGVFLNDYLRNQFNIRAAVPETAS